MISWILVTLIAYTKDTEAIDEGHTLKTWDYHWMRLHIWQTNLHIGYLPYKYVGRKYVNHEEITNVFHESLMMYSNVKTKFIGNFYYQGQNFLLNFLMLKTNKLLFMVSILMINSLLFKEPFTSVISYIQSRLGTIFVASIVEGVGIYDDGSLELS